MTSRDEQKEKRRQEILYAGLGVFIRKGYSGTTIKDIASAVGMSVGLLFHYFESKEELYLELVSLGIEGPMSSLQTGDADVFTFFEKTAERILSYIKTDPFVSKMFVLMHQAYYSEDVPLSVKELLKGFDIYSPTADMIRCGQKTGSIREGDPVALAIAFWSAIQGIAETLAVHQELPCPEGRWISDLLRKQNTAEENHQ
jgi:AcrR family transcriptional regulator